MEPPVVEKNDSRHERRFWLVLVCLLAAPTVAPILLPALGQWPGSLHLQQFAIGGLIAIAVGATIVSMGRRVEYAETVDPRLIAKMADPAKLYRSQKIAAFVIGLGGLCPIMVYAASVGQFAEFGGFLTAPLSLIGPGLWIREVVWGCPSQPITDQWKDSP